MFSRGEGGEVERVIDRVNVNVAYYKEAVLVTGAFDIKDELNDLGGKYNRQLKGWVFSEKKRDEVFGLVKESLEGHMNMRKREGYSWNINTFYATG